MAGGVQGRKGGVKSAGIIHGFPRVPARVNDSHVLRRYLQDLRDSLNEYRWLFGGLAGLSSKQQKALTDALLKLIQQELELKRLLTVQENQNLTVQQMQLVVNQLQQDVASLNINVSVLQNENVAQQNQIDQLLNDNASQQAQINQLLSDVATIQANCC